MLVGQGTGIINAVNSIGNDTLIGANSIDTITGGIGADTVDLEGAGTIYAGSGNDTGIYNLSDHYSLNGGVLQSIHGDVDYYYGQGGTNTLRMVLTSDEASLPEVQADLAAYKGSAAKRRLGLRWRWRIVNLVADTQPLEENRVPHVLTDRLTVALCLGRWSKQNEYCHKTQPDLQDRCLHRGAGFDFGLARHRRAHDVAGLATVARRFPALPPRRPLSGGGQKCSSGGGCAGGHAGQLPTRR